MEEWKDIIGYEGYQASNYGRIRSKDRVIKLIRKGNRVVRHLKGRILKPAPHSIEHPYPYFQAGAGRTLGVHQAVALAFHGKKPLGCYACHKDGNPENNYKENIYWGTPKQNQQDRFSHGRGGCGEQHSQAKLTEDDVRDIRRRLAMGEKQKDIGAIYGITQSSVSFVKSNRNWGHTQ